MGKRDLARGARIVRTWAPPCVPERTADLQIPPGSSAATGQARKTDLTQLQEERQAGHDHTCHGWPGSMPFLGSLYTRSSPRQSHNQGDDEDNEEDEKQQLSNPYCSTSNASKAQYGGNKCND